MSAKSVRPRLSKGILEMKFMQRTKAKVDKEIEDLEGRSMYEREISDRMLHSNTNFILEPSFVHCEDLIEGRLSFRGMNPEIERLLELEQAERQAAVRHEQKSEVSDKDMLAFYHQQRAPAASNTMQRKFNKKPNNMKRRNAGNAGMAGTHKKHKFLKPRDDDDNDADADADATNDSTTQVADT